MSPIVYAKLLSLFFTFQNDSDYTSEINLSEKTLNASGVLLFIQKISY